LDEIDNLILKNCIEDSRQSYREIARKIGVSPGTVASRMKEMEEQGIIKKFSAQLDYEKIGFELTVIIEVTVSKGMIVEVGQEISKLKPACAVYNVTGESDVMVLAKFKTREDLSNFTKTVLKLPNVERTKSHLALITLKEDFNIL